jgi:hypothetical protein
MEIELVSYTCAQLIRLNPKVEISYKTYTDGKMPFETVYLNIALSAGFQVPKVYLSDSKADCEEALLLGAFVQQHVRTQRATGDLKAQQEAAAAELAALRATKDAELAAAKAELATAQTAAQQAAQAAQAAHQKSLQDATRLARREERDQTQLEMQAAVEKAQQRCEAAEERRRLLEAERAADIAAAEERVRGLLQHTLTIREEQVRSGQEALKALEAAYKAQVEEIRALNDFVRRKTQNAKLKGNEFEEAFRGHLLKAFSILEGFEIVDTAKNGIGHAGDFLIRFQGRETLWEVKNYDKIVQKSEVEKFRRDMLENKAVQVGVMISKSTDIVGKVAKGYRELEFVEGKLLVYVSRFEMHEDPVEFLQSLLPLFQIWWESQREDETAAVLADTLKELERLLGDLTRKRTEWRVHKARLEETTRWMAEVVEDAEARVESLLRLMRAGQTVGGGLEVPEGIFRSLHADDRIRETVGIVLEAYAPGEGEVRLNDLAELLAAKRSLAKTTAKQHILAALQDAVVISAPGKPTLVRGLSMRK